MSFYLYSRYGKGTTLLAYEEGCKAECEAVNPYNKGNPEEIFSWHGWNEGKNEGKKNKISIQLLNKNN